MIMEGCHIAVAACYTAYVDMLQVCYLCDSETEQVEWLSALEGTVLRIVRSAAGVDEDASAAASVSAKPSKPARDEKQHNSEWARKLEAGFSSTSARGGGGAADLGSNPMVKVVGFDSAGQDDYGAAQSSQHNDYSSTGAGYSSIAGCEPIRASQSSSKQILVLGLVLVLHGQPTNRMHPGPLPDAETDHLVRCNQLNSLLWNLQQIR